MDSALRHAAQVVDGRYDENHLIAAIWNLVCAYQTILWIQEGKLPPKLYDMPRKIILPDPYGEYVINDWSKIPSFKELEEAISKDMNDNTGRWNEGEQWDPPETKKKKSKKHH